MTEAYPRRVLFIIDELVRVGGAELALLRIVAGLTERGISCRVVTFRLAPGFPTIACPVEVITLEKVLSLGGWRAARQLRRILREQPIDVVHTFFETSDIFGGLVARLSGCRIVMSSQRDMGILRSPRHWKAYRLMHGLFHEFHAVSDAVRRQCITRMGLPPSRIRTIHNGVDLPLARVIDRDCRRSELGLPVGVPLVVCVGNLRYVKGIDVLVETADHLRQTIPDVRFVVVGGSPEPEFANSVKATIEQRGLGETVHLLGARKQVLEIVELCDVFCMLSRSEGLSNAVLEAMSVGIPCVVTDVGGNPEVVEDARNGFLVPTEDPIAACRALEKLILDPALRQAFSASARQTVSDRFTTNVMMDALLKSYREALVPPKV